MCSIILIDTCLVGKCTGAVLGDPGKYAVPCAKSRDIAADGDDFAREFVAKHEGQTRPQDGPQLSLPEFEINRVQARSACGNKNIARARYRRRDIHQLPAVRTAVLLKNICAHVSSTLLEDYLISPMTRNQENRRFLRSPSSQRIAASQAS